MRNLLDAEISFLGRGVTAMNSGSDRCDEGQFTKLHYFCSQSLSQFEVCFDKHQVICQGELPPCTSSLATASRRSFPKLAAARRIES
jgi:hypothetical protein